MKILGIGSPFGHDASAALLIDGEVVAAAEEERFTRSKHAVGQAPVNAIRFCLKQAGIKPSDIEMVAYPWSYQALLEKRAEYFWRTIFTKPSRAYKKFFNCRRELAGQERFLKSTLEETGIVMDKVSVKWVEHHLAHAASSFYLSGADEAAVMSIDGGGEITATLLGHAKDGRINKIKEIPAPDSLGNFYSTMTDYLGFEREDGEYKVMGMAPFGDTAKINFDHIIYWKNKSYHCNDGYVWVTRSRRARFDKVYSKKMVNEFGPERSGDGLSEPYINIAAITQKKLEDMTLLLLDAYLGDILKKCGNLVFAGGCALNVSLNRKLLEHPLVKFLWVQPASHDAGTSLGAAVFAANEAGDKIKPMEHVYLGPEFDDSEIERAVKENGFSFTKEKDIADTASDLIKNDNIVGWFQGRMEWGPRALGNRSILGNPVIKGTADRINEIIKFREKWRPFCPSILKEYAEEIIESKHPSAFMTFSFKVSDKWRNKIPEVVHVDGTARPQIVEEITNPRYYRLLRRFCDKTGIPVLINTSLNRRGEPMVCSPQDAFVMFKESGLKYLAMGDYLIKK
ncbi:MAG: carbamoyltransferase [Candidatus Omnitrophica bacterium CG11_big_fil_rev_8_21_14_0_20_42_13]|uniref:Carbamoyltransferase n=1 Tax=Candidatus Ghiorseimicrobium undicola TaxID=1974746 RepID=A0A2H0LY69_9BACT|nr:MAG: carbamoyltransferase [Candidatus Omnitrophica bacterium CG11_big_fil_rev_8_21_14_0_20_42_13]